MKTWEVLVLLFLLVFAYGSCAKALWGQDQLPLPDHVKVSRILKVNMELDRLAMRHNNHLRPHFIAAQEALNKYTTQVVRDSMVVSTLPIKHVDAIKHRQALIKAAEEIIEDLERALSRSKLVLEAAKKLD